MSSRGAPTALKLTTLSPVGLERTDPRNGGDHRAGTVTLPDAYRLLFRQEFSYRHLWEWTTLAEDRWTHNGALPQFP